MWPLLFWFFTLNSQIHELLLLFLLQVRVVLKYRHCDGNLCIKVTDNSVVSDMMKCCFNWIVCIKWYGVWLKRVFTSFAAGASKSFFRLVIRKPLSLLFVPIFQSLKDCLGKLTLVCENWGNPFIVTCNCEGGYLKILNCNHQLTLNVSALLLTMHRCIHESYRSVWQINQSIAQKFWPDGVNSGVTNVTNLRFILVGMWTLVPNIGANPSF